MKFVLGLTVGCFLLGACVGDDPGAGPTTAPSDDGGTASEGGSETGPGQDASVADAFTCNGSVCGGACVVLATSADNCGVCGHSCGNGICAGGVCQPALVQNNIPAPVAVAVAAQSVFWLRDGAVERCGTTGCASPTTITAEAVVPTTNPTGTIMVTDGSFVAWLSQASGADAAQNLHQCSVAGCLNGQSPKQSTNLIDPATQLAIFGSNVYTIENQGTVHTGPISSLVMTGLAGTANDVPTGLAVNATKILFAGVFGATGRGVGSYAIGGGSSAPLFVDASASRIALAGDVVVALSSGSGISSCTLPTCGGAPKILAPDDKSGMAIAGDGKFVVWAVPGDLASATGKIRACAMPDCKAGPMTIADKQAQPVSVTIADGFVYWANKGFTGVSGSVWRAAL